MFQFGQAVGRLEQYVLTHADEEGDPGYESAFAQLHAAVIQVFEQIEVLPGNDLENLRLQARCLLWAQPDLEMLAGQSLASRMARAIINGLLGLTAG
jgi:hypothetical protein